jgi:hypothetical protein
MANASPAAPPILLVFLINAGPLIAFVVLYALDFFNLVKEGVYTEEESPIGDLIFIFLLAIVGIPYALIRRRRAVKVHYELGGKPLGGRYIFYNVAFGVVLGVWGLLLVCSVCSWIYITSRAAA